MIHVQNSPFIIHQPFKAAVLIHASQHCSPEAPWSPSWFFYKSTNAFSPEITDSRISLNFIPVMAYYRWPDLVKYRHWIICICNHISNLIFSPWRVENHHLIIRLVKGKTPVNVMNWPHIHLRFFFWNGHWQVKGHQANSIQFPNAVTNDSKIYSPCAIMSQWPEKHTGMASIYKQFFCCCFKFFLHMWQLTDVFLSLSQFIKRSCIFHPKTHFITQLQHFFTKWIVNTADKINMCCLKQFHITAQNSLPIFHLRIWFTVTDSQQLYRLMIPKNLLILPLQRTKSKLLSMPYIGLLIIPIW